MARYSWDVLGEQDEQDKKKKTEQGLSFKELLAIVYGCDPYDCNYSLPRMGGKCDAWLDQFSKAENCNIPSGPQSTLVTGAPIADIRIRHNEVAGVVDAEKSPRDNLMTALAMATCAKAHKNMRKSGARIEGRTPQEKIYLMIAAEYVGLKLQKVDPKLKKQMEQIKAQIKADDIWRDYRDIMDGKAPASPEAEQHTAEEAPKADDKPEADKAQEPLLALPPPKPSEQDLENGQEQEPEKLTQIFNREIAADAKPFLEASKIDEKTYKALSEAIIRDQDARGSMVKERYKDKYGLTESQLQDVLKAMDAEGLTTVHPGKPRAINYDRNGIERARELTQIFNREIAADAKPFLTAAKIDEDTYKALSKAIIRDQDARESAIKERYKDQFNLTGKQIRNVLKAMDAEGLTSTQPGKPRAINYSHNGAPKDGMVPPAP